MHNKFLVFLFLFSFSVYYAQTEVKVGLYVKNLILDNEDNSFFVDLYWWTKVPKSVDPKLADEYSKIEFLNIKSVDDFQITEKAETDDFYYYTGICKGTFTHSPNYKEYPVDKHKIPIIIESINLSNDLVKLVPDLQSYGQKNFQGFNEKISLTDFNILSSSFDGKTQIYDTNFGDPKLSKNSQYSRINYDVLIERKSISYLLKILIPCILLSLIAYLVFFIPAERLDVAVGCTVTSLLAAIAVQLTTVSDIPQTGYLTNADLIYYLFYSLICCALVQTVYTYNLEVSGKLELSRKFEIAGRILYPIILISGLIFILI